MSDAAFVERITRLLAFMLRHQPEDFDLEVDPFGWADCDEVVRALNERLGGGVEVEDLEQAVGAGDRQRYEIDDDRIRALYGHSIAIEPGEPTKPPERLYVGLPAKDAERALHFGLRGGRRRFLHLGTTERDARETGKRAGRDYTVIEVRALDAWEEGVNFYDRKSLFLAEEVPANLLEEGASYSDGTPREEREGRRGGGRRPDRERGEHSERGGRGRDRGRGPRRGDSRQAEPRRDDSRRVEARAGDSRRDEPRRSEGRRDEGGRGERSEGRRGEGSRREGRRDEGRRGGGRRDEGRRDEARRGEGREGHSAGSERPRRSERAPARAEQAPPRKPERQPEPAPESSFGLGIFEKQVEVQPERKPERKPEAQPEQGPEPEPEREQGSDPGSGSGAESEPETATPEDSGSGFGAGL